MTYFSSLANIFHFFKYFYLDPIPDNLGFVRITDPSHLLQQSNTCDIHFVKIMCLKTRNMYSSKYYSSDLQINLLYFGNEK